jgi:thioredoxin-related protein
MKLKKRHMILIVIVFIISSFWIWLKFDNPKKIKIDYVSNEKIADEDNRYSRIIRIKIDSNDVNILKKSSLYMESFSLRASECKKNNIYMYIGNSNLVIDEAYVNFKIDKQEEEYINSIENLCFQVETTQTMFGHYMISNKVKVR